MRVMSELMLIEETMERASAQLQSMLTLLQLSFDAGAATARRIHGETGRVIDPVASSLYEEARALLMLPYPRLSHAFMALAVAAAHEPECYGTTHAAMLELIASALEDTVEDELAASEPPPSAPNIKPQNRS